MGVEIDKRPIWILLGIKGLRGLFFLSIAVVCYLIVSIPVDGEGGLTPGGRNALAIFFVCLVLWVSNALPLAITSLLAIVLVPLLGVLPKGEVYSLFGNEAVFFILGAFILAGAVMHSGLSNRIALAILDRFGSSPKRLLLSIFLLAAVLSFFMSEHAVAAMLFPIVIEITKGLELKPGRSRYGKYLFLALAWGCVIGGVATFLGGARVPLAVGILSESTGVTINFLSYTLAVLPLVVVMLFIGAFILTRPTTFEVSSVAKAHELLLKRIHVIGKVRYREYAVGILMALTVLAWMTIGHRIGLASIALVSVVALFVFRLVRWKDVEEYVNWGVVLMYGGAIVLGTALERSGAAHWMAEEGIGMLIVNPFTAIAVFSLLTLMLTECISNAAVIAILLPVGIGLTGQFDMDPTIVTMAIAVPAGLAFSLPMATPANALAVSSGFLGVGDMVKLGVVMSAIAYLVFNLLAKYYWPLIGFGY